jgi:glycerate dehydrogenase
MNIVILDGYSLNPGDLSWAPFEKSGELKVYDRTSPAEIIERSKNADVLITNKTPINRNTIEQLPALKYIGVLATGYNIVDIVAAKEKGIPVSNVPGYGSASVVQLTFSFILEHFNQLAIHDASVKRGEWVNSKDFSYSKTPLTEIRDKTIGIIGFGSIGQQVSDVATAFGMHTIAYSRTRKDQLARNNFSWVALDELYRQADVISIHCPLTDETKGMINMSALTKMKPTVFIVNTARGPIIVEEDLAKALNDGIIAGAGLDVLSQEPPHKDNPLLSAKNTLITPHIAWATTEARSRLLTIASDNLAAFIEHRPVNIVNS